MKKRGAMGTYIVMVAAVVLSKLLGMVRNMLLARFYGTGAMADAFTAASSLPLTVYDVTLGTAIASAFVPVFNEKLTKEGKEPAERFGSNFLNIALLFMMALAGIGMLFPKGALAIVASGLSGESLEIAISLVRIILPIMAIAAGTYIFVGILQSYNSFMGPALVSLVSNIALIFYFLILDRHFRVYGLAVAFTIGWLLQLLSLLPYLKKEKFRYYFHLDFRSAEIKRVMILTLPLLVAALAQPINQLISTNISSGLGEGSLASVNYAYQAYFVVSGIFSYCLSNLFFPEMSRCFARGDQQAAVGICRRMLGAIAVIVLPIMAFMGGNSKPVIRLLYQGKNFTEADTALVGTLLTIYSAAMLFYSFQDILNKYFYSMQKVKMPVITALSGISVNLLISLLAVKKLGVFGLAIGTLTAAFVMAVLLLIFAKRVSPAILNRSLFIGWGKDLVGACALFVGAREIRILIEKQIDGALGTGLGLLGGAAVGFGLYFLILWLLGSEELKQVLQKTKKNN